MTKIRFIAALAAAAALLASCSKDKDPKDVKIVGDIALTGEFTCYMHGNGWMEADTLGVFVKSEKGFPQKNLQYKPSEVVQMVESPYAPGYFMPGDPVGNVSLTPLGAAAGFKEGEHKIYAYLPYAPGNNDCTAIPLPDLSEQYYVPGQFSVDASSIFAYAGIDSFSEYSAAAKDFGNFKSAFVQMTVPSPEFPDEAEGKKLTEVSISAAKDIAVKKATIDITSGEIKGELVKSVVYLFPDGGLELTKGFFGVSAETLYLLLSIDEEDALDTEFTFKYIVDGKEYSCSGKPIGKDNMMYTEGNLNMYGSLSFAQ